MCSNNSCGRQVKGRVFWFQEKKICKNVEAPNNMIYLRNCKLDVNIKYGVRWGAAENEFSRKFYMNHIFSSVEGKS